MKMKMEKTATLKSSKNIDWFRVYARTSEHCDWARQAIEKNVNQTLIYWGFIFGFFFVFFCSCCCSNLCFFRCFFSTSVGAGFCSFAFAIIFNEFFCCCCRFLYNKLVMNSEQRRHTDRLASSMPSLVICLCPGDREQVNRNRVSAWASWRERKREGSNEFPSGTGFSKS